MLPDSYLVISMIILFYMTIMIITVLPSTKLLAIKLLGLPKTDLWQSGSCTGQPRYVKFAYLKYRAYVEVIIHSRAFSLYCSVFQTYLCRTRLSRNLGYIEVFFHSRKLVFRFFTNTCVGQKIKQLNDKQSITFRHRTIAFNSVQHNPLLRVMPISYSVEGAIIH